MQSQCENVDYACCINATAPFVTTKDIKKGYEMIIEMDSDYAVSVTSFPFPTVNSTPLRFPSAR